MTSDAVLESLMDRIQDECIADGSTGMAVYTGVFASGGRQSNRIPLRLFLKIEINLKTLFHFCKICDIIIAYNAVTSYKAVTANP